MIVILETVYRGSSLGDRRPQYHLTCFNLEVRKRSWVRKRTTAIPYRPVAIRVAVVTACKRRFRAGAEINLRATRSPKETISLVVCREAVFERRHKSENGAVANVASLNITVAKCQPVSCKKPEAVLPRRLVPQHSKAINGDFRPCERGANRGRSLSG